MQTNIDTFVNQKIGSVHLLVEGVSEKAFKFTLAKNAIVLAGSGRNCGLQLTGQNVQPLHCRIYLDEDSNVFVQDWNTEGKTLINGQPISGEPQLKIGDELQIGLYRISLISSAPAQRLDDRESNHTDPAPEPKDSSEGQGANQQDDDYSTDADLPTVVIPSPKKLDIGDHREAFEYLLELDDEMFDDAPSAPVQNNMEPTDYSAGYEFDSQTSFESQGTTEEVELLRMEVEQLHCELAERDVQLAMLSANSHSACQDDEGMDDDESLRLENRLEELLEELQSTDERVRGMEELLRVSDQATQAEQEERTHLERWVTEIERRVANREAESLAEVQRISVKFQESQQRLELTELQLKKVVQLKSGDTGEPDNDFLEKLAARVAELQNKLSVVMEENEELKNKDVRDEANARVTLEYQQMEQTLLQVQVESSREKAELARDRAELERLKEELQSKLEAKTPLNEADSRIRAMRQHLQEIHDREKHDSDNNKQTGLGGRIANLLNRVGR